MGDHRDISYHADNAICLCDNHDAVFDWSARTDSHRLHQRHAGNLVLHLNLQAGMEHMLNLEK